MAMTSLEAARRADVGKGVARKLRAGGRVPAVYYGRGEDSIPLTVALKDLEAVIESAEGSNVIVDLKLPGAASKDRKALIREIQRDPVAGHLPPLGPPHISPSREDLVGGPNLRPREPP